MQFLLLSSLKLFLHAYLEAFCFNSKKQRPFSLNRVLFLVFIFPAFAVLQLIHCLGFLLDHLLRLIPRRTRLLRRLLHPRRLLSRRLSQRMHPYRRVSWCRLHLQHHPQKVSEIVFQFHSQ